jgi:hypothetical protein
MFWPIGFALVLVGSSIAWWRRSSKIEEEDTKRQEVVDERGRKFDEMYDLSVGTGGRLKVVNEKGQIVQTGDPLVATRPSTIFKTPGVGPVTVTVPSGGLFGLDPEEKIVFTLPASVESFNLPEGGTVAAQLSATVNSVSEVKGHLTTGEEGKE